MTNISTSTTGVVRWWTLNRIYKFVVFSDSLVPHVTFQEMWEVSKKKKTFFRNQPVKTLSELLYFLQREKMAGNFLNLGLNKPSDRFRLKVSLLKHHWNCPDSHIFYRPLSPKYETPKKLMEQTAIESDFWYLNAFHLSYSAKFLVFSFRRR